tara:strand:+ start:223 stop:549 length:327 start_codon:yes stop_codon:yes gene_type:complete
MLPLGFTSPFYVSDNEISLMALPLVNLNLIKTLLLESLEDDSVPKVHVNVPPLVSISPPEEHPGSAVVGTPDPLYAWNISAQPFVPDNDVVQVLLSGIHTQHPVSDPV